MRGVKKRFCLCGNLRREFTLSVTLKPIDSPERLSSKIHPTYFTLECCLISMPLYAIFKDLAFQGLCLAPNKIDFDLSFPKCILNFFSANRSHNLEKSLISCFSISVTLLCWNTIQVSLA